MNGTPAVWPTRGDRPSETIGRSKNAEVWSAHPRRSQFKSAGERWREARGSAIVESAVILLFFFTLILAVFEMGRFFSVQQTMADAAREGARLAVTPLVGTDTLPDDAAIEAWVNRFLASNGLSTATVTISVVDPEADDEDLFTEVLISMPYQVLTAAWFNDLEVTVQARSRMRNETSS